LRGFVVGTGVGDKLTAGLAMRPVKRQLTVTFQEFIALFGLARWTAVRRAGVVLALRRMCLELVKNTAESEGFGSIRPGFRSRDLEAWRFC
jgi:hypothetical protein